MFVLIMCITGIIDFDWVMSLLRFKVRPLVQAWLSWSERGTVNP